MTPHLRLPSLTSTPLELCFHSTRPNITPAPEIASARDESHPSVGAAETFGAVCFSFPGRWGACCLGVTFGGGLAHKPRLWCKGNGETIFFFIYISSTNQLTTSSWIIKILFAKVMYARQTAAWIPLPRLPNFFFRACLHSCDYEREESRPPPQRTPVHAHPFCCWHVCRASRSLW